MTTRELEAERAALLLSAIVDSSDDAIISKDLTGVISSWNKGAERLFGYTAAEAVGRSITILIPEDRLEEEPDILARIRRGERVDHFETVRRRKDGTLLDISLTISPVKDAQGTVIGASKIARDISQQKRIQAELLASEARFRTIGRRHAPNYMDRRLGWAGSITTTNAGMNLPAFPVMHSTPAGNRPPCG